MARDARKCVPCKAHLPVHQWACPYCGGNTERVVIFNGDPEREMARLRRMVAIRAERNRERMRGIA